MSSPFVHLHVHTEYSMLEGALRVRELVDRAEALGMPAVAVTDRGNMYAAVQLVQACEGKDVEPILGVEIQIVPGDRREEAPKAAPHLVLLAASQEGYRNIVRIVSRAWVEGLFRGQPRADYELLREHSEGVVCLTACMAGLVPQAILEQGPDAGREELRKLKDIYGPERLFVELEDHGFPENEPLNEILVELAEELELRVVATNCAHFLEREQAKSQVALRCIGTGRSLREMEQIHHKSAEMYFKDEAEMREIFSRWPEAVDNTLVVAEMCAGKCTPLHEPKLPRFPVPEGGTEESYLRELVRQGIEARFDEAEGRGEAIDRDTYLARIEEELGIICGMGFPGYFLIVQDFINWAKAQGIPVGPGRGSGAGSLVAYALRITNLDPIPYGLLFERFLNPERVSMPDFDIDFCTDRREEVIDYVREKYGRHSVGQIATFHQLKSRSVVRDVGRVMGMAPQDAGRIATLIPEPVGGKVVPIARALEEVSELSALVRSDPEARAVIETAQDLENLTRHAGMHAAGVVMSEGPIWDHVPVFCPEQGVIVTQYHKDDVEAAGLVKFDFLGLKTLTVLDVAVKLVNKRPDRKDSPIDLDTLPLDDVATYALLQSGETSNVFQLESSGMQQFFKQMKPDCFEDIVAAVALYRPGPMGADMHLEFAERKRGRQAVKYPHPALEEILRPTLGAIVYQEQVMQIAQQMGGYTLGGADLLRRAMGKKKEEEMAKQKAIFVEGAREKGTPESEAGVVFDLMAHFAGYGFNKSHSAAYALLTYQTAFLKAHYPAEFMCAALSVDKEKSDNVVATVQEARSMGIHVLPPDVNQSAIDFTVVYMRPDGSSLKRPPDRPACEGGQMRDPYEPRIRFGLGALKGIGHSALDAIFEAREVDDESGESRHDPFVDLFDFAERVDLRRVNKNVCEALVQSGAFDEVHAKKGIHRARAFEAIPAAIESGKKLAADRASGQTSLFGLLGDDAAAETLAKSVASFPEVDAWDSKDLLAREKRSLGFYVSGHPLDRYEKELARFCTCNSQTAQNMDANQDIVLGGMVEGYRERRTKSGDTIAFFHLEDAYGRIEVIVRPSILELEGTRQALQSGEPVVVEGRLKREFRSEGNDERPEMKLQLKSAGLLAAAFSKKARYLRISVLVDDVDRSSLTRLRTTLEGYPGACPVRLRIANQGAFAVELKETGLSIEPSDDLFASLERIFGRRVSELR